MKTYYIDGKAVEYAEFLHALNSGVYTLTEATETEEKLVTGNPEVEIKILKNKLKETDYRAIKYAEGFLSEEEYSETKAQRQAWRDEINALEAKLQEAAL